MQTHTHTKHTYTNTHRHARTHTFTHAHTHARTHTHRPIHTNTHCTGLVSWYRTVPCIDRNRAKYKWHALIFCITGRIILWQKKNMLCAGPHEPFRHDCPLHPDEYVGSKYISFSERPPFVYVQFRPHCVCSQLAPKWFTFLNTKYYSLPQDAWAFDEVI